MFGYVLPPWDALPPEERERFQRVYCGLCHTLRRRYGQAERFLLNYDFTFLAVLLSGGVEPPLKRGRCVPHPVHGRVYPVESAALNLAADESIILAWWKLRDDREDREASLRTEGASLLLRRAYRRAAAYRPAFAASVERQMGILRTLEREQCPSLDIPADAFAVLLREAALASEADGETTGAGRKRGEDSASDGETAGENQAGAGAGCGQEDARRRILAQLLYHLGRWIYLIDAADDLRRDAASGNYNPVALRYGLRSGVWTPSAKEDFALTLDHSVHLMATAFELWDFGVWTALLEATLYRGLFQVGRAVLDGSFHRRPSPLQTLREQWNASVMQGNMAQIPETQPDAARMPEDGVQ